MFNEAWGKLVEVSSSQTLPDDLIFVHFGRSLPKTACATGAWEGMRSWRPRNPGLGRAGPSDNRHLLGSGMRPNMRT